MWLAGARFETGLCTDTPARFGDADRLAEAGSGKAQQTVIDVVEGGGADKLVVAGFGGTQQNEIIFGFPEGTDKLASHETMPRRQCSQSQLKPLESSRYMCTHHRESLRTKLEVFEKISG